jgi:hypothetical protein
MNYAKLLSLTCGLLLGASQALAGPLAIDTTAIAGFHNSSPFSNAFHLAGSVDYAVYAPGTFPAGFLGYTPTPGDYVYAYQAHETGSADLSQFSVTLTAPVDPVPNIGDFSGANGFGLVAGDPSISAFVTPMDSANWLFDGVVTGGSTDGLAFSSPNPPTWSVGRTVDDGTIAFPIPVPGPKAIVPEPSTLILALFGFGIMVFQWLRERERKNKLVIQT